MNKRNHVRNTKPLISYAIYNDRLAGLILHLHLPPLSVGFIALAIVSLASLVISFVAGVVVANRSYIGLFADRVYIVSVAVLIPLIWGYYAWVIRFPADVSHHLQLRQVINHEENELATQLEVYRNKNSLIIASFLGLLTSGLFYLRDMSKSPNWLNLIPAFHIIYTVLILAPTTILAWSILIRFIQNARFIKTLLKDAVVFPLHPDKAGGLEPICRYALISSLPFAIGGCISVFAGYSLYLDGELATTYYAQAFLVICVILTLLCYIVPLFLIHQTMVSSKKTSIAIISSEKDIEYELSIRGFTGSSRTLIEQLEYIRKLEQLGQEVDDQFPVWPTNTNTSMIFILALLSPFFLLMMFIFLEIL